MRIIYYIFFILLFSCNRNNKIITINENDVNNKQKEMITNSSNSEEDKDLPYKYPKISGWANDNTDLPFNIESGKYHILDYPVNIRNKPSLNGEVIGQLQLHDEIEIIENMGNPLFIDGVLQNWYKIKYNKKESFIWGGYIAIKTFIFDIDKNGVEDYCYYRYSYDKYKGYNPKNDDYIYDLAIFTKDIFIYLNNKKVNNSIIDEFEYNEWAGEEERGENTRLWYIEYIQAVYFSIVNNKLEIELECAAPYALMGSIGLKYEMDANGIITFIYTIGP